MIKLTTYDYKFKKTYDLRIMVSREIAEDLGPIMKAQKDKNNPQKS